MRIHFTASICLLLAGALQGQPPVIDGCLVFPPENIWNTRVDTLPIDAKSAAYVATIGASNPLVPDFGSGTFAGGPIGIPFVTVGGDQAKVAVQFQYADESDPGPYPVPAGAPIEGGPQSNGDRHVLILDRGRCRLYELYSAYPQADGSWKAGSGAIFDLASNALRPAGWTSADAAGFPIVPGLVRYEEIAAGEIRHAIRFTVPRTRREYVWPATHFASSLTGAEYPPMGQRFRLRADYDISGFSPANQIILRALKKYGMLLADNGSAWFLSGAPDDRWNNEQLRELRRVHGSDFEAVDTTSLQVAPTSGAARQSPPNVVNAASGIGQAIAPGEAITITGDNIGSDQAAVTFDGTSGALLYGSARQINVIAPNEIAGRSQVSLAVSANGATTFSAAIPVAPQAPALFTTGENGAGQAAAYNEDGSTNAPATPAARGSVVTVFGTGSGVADVTAFSARIGGAPAEIVNVAMAPGMFQASIRIPANVAPGQASILLTIGAYVTQSGVELTVR